MWAAIATGCPCPSNDCCWFCGQCRRQLDQPHRLDSRKRSGVGKPMGPRNWASFGAPGRWRYDS